MVGYASGLIPLFVTSQKQSLLRTHGQKYSIILKLPNMASEASEISVKVHVLPTGYLWLPDRWIFSDGDVELKHLAPDYSFLIRHPSGRNVLFDLGLRKVSKEHSE